MDYEGLIWLRGAMLAPLFLHGYHLLISVPVLESIQFAINSSVPGIIFPVLFSTLLL